MIPHRAFSNDLFGNGLKGRVTACRKRLRVHRSANRPHLLSPLEEMFTESHLPASEFLDDYVEVRQSTVCSPDLMTDPETSASEPAHPVEEQEVGIT